MFLQVEVWDPVKIKYSGCGGGRSSRIDIFMSHIVILTLIWLGINVEKLEGRGTGVYC